MMTKEEQTHICRRCGRKLRSAESQERGMGPSCFAKSQAEDRRAKLFTVGALQMKKNTV